MNGPIERDEQHGQLGVVITYDVLVCECVAVVMLLVHIDVDLVEVTVVCDVVGKVETWVFSDPLTVLLTVDIGLLSEDTFVCIASSTSVHVLRLQLWVFEHGCDVVEAEVVVFSWTSDHLRLDELVETWQSCADWCESEDLEHEGVNAYELVFGADECVVVDHLHQCRLEVVHEQLFGLFVTNYDWCESSCFEL